MWTTASRAGSKNSSFSNGRSAKTADAWDAVAICSGNLFYDRRRYEEAILHWESVRRRLNPSFATVHRNLGIAYFNVRQDPDRALS